MSRLHKKRFTNQQGLFNEPTGFVRLWVIVLLTSGGLGFSQESPRLSAEAAAKLVAISNDAETPSVSPPVIHPTGYRELLKRVTPSVVSVFPEQLITIDEDTSDPLSRFFGKQDSESDDDESEGHDRRMGVGSGVILSADGWIVTNSHVVHLPSGKLADSASVELHNREVLKAIIVGADPLTDIALLKVDAKELTPLSLADSDEVQTGDLVFAVGNPFKLGMTATMGMVSATNRTSLNLNGNGGYESFIQTDAAINPGNSGGALVDSRGRLVGINTAIYSGAGGNIGLGFAVPTQLMSEVVEGLAEHGEMHRGFFGIQTDEMNGDRAKEAGAPEISGVWIVDLMKGGPAELAGLQVGDVITHAADRRMDTRGNLRVAFSCIAPGESINLTIIRSGTTMEVAVKAGESPSTENAVENLFTLDAIPGVKFLISENGLEIAKKESASKGAGDQLEVGMIIVSVNGKPVESAEDAGAAFRKGVNKVVTRLRDAQRTLALRIE